MCSTYFEASALCVRLPCVTAVLPCAQNVSYSCTGVLCYPLRITWDSRVCVPLTSRHLLCVYVSRVLRLCCLVHERVVLCVPVYCATHCIVPGIRGCVWHLLRGTCSVCTCTVRYGCVAFVHERVVLCVPVYCATHCIVPGIRGCMYHVLRGTCSVYTLVECYGCATLCMNVSYYVYRCTVLPIA